ncbi:MAG: hypothetical protein ACXWOL_18115 [Ktedonobacteraceae bacterium]
MKNDGMLFIVFIVVLVFIPGACAVSIGGGASISGSGSSQGIVVASGTHVAGISTASGVMSGTEDHWIGDTSGKLAEVKFDVENAAKWTHSYKISPGSIDQYKYSTAQATVSAQEWLDVTNADSINANAYATNGEGDTASAGILMGVPGYSISNLAGYTNSATVTATQSKASQSATSASDNQIIFNNGAINAELDSANVNLNVQAGSVTSYIGSATGTKTQATASQSASTATSYSADVISGANNAEGDVATSNFIDTNGAVAGYANSLTATKGQVTASQSAKSASGTSMLFGAYDSNIASDAANPSFGFSGGSVTGYSASRAVTKSQVTASQSATSAQANLIDASSSASNNNGGVSYYTTIQAGQLSGYSDKDTVTATSTQISGALTAATGSNIYTNSYASNVEGDFSGSGLSITNGKLSGYSDKPTATATSSQTSPAITSATGSLIDLHSLVLDDRFANEYLSSTWPVPVNMGTGNFEYTTSGSLAATKLQSTATSNNVVITPTLPTTVKTAIMLEPFNYAFATVYGATDLGTTVLPDLVGKRYATLRYTDAGASSDKFKNLGKYDVALVWAHMNSDVIGLSTINPNNNDYYIPASQLSYTTAKKPMVILAGCDSFDGYPTTKSPLANAVKTAYLSGGNSNSVYILWEPDFLSYFFNALSNGATANDANNAAYTQESAKWISIGGTIDQDTIPLVFYGNTGFKL